VGSSDDDPCLLLPQPPNEQNISTNSASSPHWQRSQVQATEFFQAREVEKGTECSCLAVASRGVRRRHAVVRLWGVHSLGRADERHTTNPLTSTTPYSRRCNDLGENEGRFVGCGMSRWRARLSCQAIWLKRRRDESILEKGLGGWLT
jgi:hypothetical protein